MPDPYFFGYGSLVNDATHTYPDARPATLSGWRRAWVGSPKRGVVLLTAVAAPGQSIEGLVAAVPGGNWAALDQREEGYERVPTKDVQPHSPLQSTDLAVYSVHPDNRHATNDQVILMSYLDVVVQGFLNVFGPEGAHRFFDTTDGWDTHILNDRANPIYPRSQKLNGDETAVVDAHLVRLKATVLPVDATSARHRF